MDKPHIHLTPERNWMNDPVGFLYFKGEYHIFYQYFPYAMRWGTMHWGHAVSTDLIHWSQLPIALYPTVDADRNGCFSGSAVEQEGKMHLFYTGVRYDAARNDDIHIARDNLFTSCQMDMWSPDGRKFDNERDKHVVLPPFRDPARASRIHTRDPKVWREPDGWHMVLGSQYTEGEQLFPELLFLNSTDGSHWHMQNRFCAPGYGSMWECPDLFRIGGGWGLVVSPMDMGPGEGPAHITCCAVAGFDPETGLLSLDPSRLIPADQGMDLYAAQSTPDQEGRRVQLAWLRMPLPLEGADWIGMLTLPRLITESDGVLRFEAHPSVADSFQKQIPWESAAKVFPLRLSAVFEEDGSLDLGGFEIYLRQGKLVTDRTRVFPTGQKGWLLRTETPVKGSSCRAEIYLDHGVIELFTESGSSVSQVVYGLGGEYRVKGMPEPVCMTMEQAPSGEGR